MVTVNQPGTAQALPAGNFRRMGWAFLFLGISIGPIFRLGHESFLIDVLPDCVGYLMIATAANRLLPLHRRARSVRDLALLLTYLTMPTIIQYTVVTGPSGNIVTWKAPLWPLTIVQGLLELVLVWVLCGLVADLARGAGEEVTKQRALTRRVVYVLLRILLTGGLALLLISAHRELIIAGAIAGVVVGLVLLGLMMGLMRRAERMCQNWSEVPLPLAELSDAACPGGWGFRLLVLAGVVLPLALGLGAFWYYQEWREARDEARAASSAAFFPARNAFYADLLAGRIDEAYQSTTANFKARISREQLAELARRYVAFVNRPRDRGRGGGAGASSGSDYLTEYEYTDVEEGKIVQVTITIRRDRDSILFAKPPPLKVDDFQVEEKAASERPGLPFGRLLGPGR
jgi:hypothetical protein